MEDNLTNNQKINKESIKIDYLQQEKIKEELILDKESIGKRIKQIRTEYFTKKLTQTEFGQLIDTSVKKSSVRDWENGNNLPNKERLKKIAEIGNVTLPYLYFGISEEENTNKIKPPQQEELKEESILDKKSIGRRIKEIRLNALEEKITLEQFGKMLEPSAIRPLVSKWEKGLNLPNKERLKQIAEIGNVSIEYLYFGINTKKLTEVIREIEKKPVSNVGYFITQEQINDLKRSINHIE